MSSSTNDIPEILENPTNNRKYRRGTFYGKGGFAKCYEIIDMKDKKQYAGKIVSKGLLTSSHQKEKMTQEIWIHKTLKHANVVGFYGFFEDHQNIYILLELCTRRSMMELHKRRKYLTEPETRYYMTQIISGVKYLHDHHIIHRDLKLGNLFLNEKLCVKIGDFGLATRVEFEGERKRTLCGTPNYIAPEILNKQGHSYEVDIWSMGCIMYTLLCGKPPFETSTLKETYFKIKKCEYKWVVSTISEAAKMLIAVMLQADPRSRPSVHQLERYTFLKNGYCPTSLPITSLTMAPRFNKVDSRKPLNELNNGTEKAGSPAKKDLPLSTGIAVSQPDMFDPQEHWSRLAEMLSQVLKRASPKTEKMTEEMSDPEVQPMYWISKWVDYSDKYGFGYQLSDMSVGVMFNDYTKIILLPNGINVHYIDRSGAEYYMTVDDYPKQYDKKMKLLLYFTRYMQENLMMAGVDAAKEIDSVSRMPHLYQWCRFVTAVLMQLNNGTVQINFGDHTKLIMCPLVGAVTVIDEDRSFRTFKFSTLEKNGCSAALLEKLNYSYQKISNIVKEGGNKVRGMGM